MRCQANSFEHVLNHALLNVENKVYHFLISAVIDFDTILMILYFTNIIGINNKYDKLLGNLFTFR